MNILMVAQFITPIIGGEEQYVINLSRELVRRGHQVAIATIKHPKQSDFELDAGVRIYRLQGTIERIGKVYEDDRRHAPPFPDPELTLAINRILKLELPDIVHAHNWLVYSYLPLARRSRAGLVVTLHDYSLRCATKRFMYRGSACSGPGVRKCIECASDHYGLIRGGPIYLSNVVMSRVECKLTDMFVPVSQVVAINNGLVGSKLPYQIIPNFIPDVAEQDQFKHNSLLAQLPEDGFLLFVGDLSIQKGIRVLLHAYSQLVNAPPLVLIGRRTGDTPEELPPNVWLMGSWPHGAVMEAWKRCSIAIIPSVWPEPFGMTVIEAMSVGRPIIASRIGGIADIISHGESGLLVEPGDVDGLQHTMELVLTNQEVREHLSKTAGYRSAEFSAGSIVPRIEKLYQNIISQKNP